MLQLKALNYSNLIGQLLNGVHFKVIAKPFRSDPEQNLKSSEEKLDSWWVNSSILLLCFVVIGILKSSSDMASHLNTLNVTLL